MGPDALCLLVIAADTQKVSTSINPQGASPPLIILVGGGKAIQKSFLPVLTQVVTGKMMEESFGMLLVPLFWAAY